MCSSDLSTLGALLAPENQLSELLGQSFSFHLHGTIGKVAHPAADAKFDGPPPAAKAVAHTLNPAPHMQSPSLGRR